MTQADAAEDPREGMRAAMRACAAPVTLITVRDARGEAHGMAASAVSSLSLDPPSLLVAMNRGSATREAVIAAGAFCVNFLNADQTELVSRFARADRRGERFAPGDWEDGPGGAPVCRGAFAALTGEIDRTVDYGTHSVLFGRVMAVQLGEGASDPLLWLDGAPARAQRM